MRLDLPQDVGAALRRARKERHLTQAQVAEAVGVSRDWVNRVERGRAPRAELHLLLRCMDAVGLALFADKAPDPIDVREVLAAGPDLP